MNSLNTNLFSLTLAVALIGLTSYTGPARAETTPDALIKEYLAEAGEKTASAEAGKKFYIAENKTKKGEMMACSSCHTSDPSKTGKTKAGKSIEPISHAANPKRFTDKAKVEKWFKRNCDDVLDRLCTPLEKANFIAFMKTGK